MTMEGGPISPEEEARKKTLNKRLDAVGWGLFFIMIGGLWLVPEERLPGDSLIVAAAIGVGLILLLVSGARSVYRVKVGAGAVVVGLLALAYGVSSMYGLDVPFFAIAFIVIGAVVLVGGWIGKAR